MSTEYVLFGNGKGSVEVWEHSCKFDIAVVRGETEPEWLSLHDLTLEELKEVNRQLTNTISYFDPDYLECKVDY